jgi:type I site-specific restriction-modification system R (restriction) subunit
LVGFVNGLPLVVIELKKPGVPGLASAFIQFQRDESALLSSRRDRRENCDTL